MVVRGPDVGRAMVPDADPRRSTDRLLSLWAKRPWQTAAAAIVGVAVVAYAILIQQELLLAVWLLLAGFFVHLALRFVRAVERIAGAAERLAESGD